MKKCNKNSTIILVIILFLLLLFFANLWFGSVSIPFARVWDILLGRETSNLSWEIIITQSRLPAAIVALLSGMALSVCGLILQTTFSNPLAGPEVLGINSGAGLGVALVMLLLQGTFRAGSMQLEGYLAILAGAFAGALLVTAIVLVISNWLKGNVLLLIVGLAISYLTSSVISLLNYFSTAEGVHSYLIWGMGSFSGVTMSQLPLFSFVLILGLFSSLMLIKPLNAMLLGNSYAQNLGINTRRTRNILLAITGLMTAAVTAYCGPISFIGLSVPHIARLFLKTNNHRLLLPMTICIGGCVTLLCNIASQLPGENGLIPLGALTPIFGAPIIIYIAIKERKRITS